ncbi:ATP-dependent DNA helicase [Trichonephila clavata]|uniref:ATP-dependent DNA helicase n=1 Tax=Trichonephila clavata TaxID=2740835 RepID=A0A8X6JGC7_TRICU|nr:ATP-dependent DNA helicase [Trichonephila clavata]
MYGKITNFIEGKKERLFQVIWKSRKIRFWEECMLYILEMLSAITYAYSYIRSVANIIYCIKNCSRSSPASFQAACRALGLLEDDTHWNSTLEEASISESPNKIRELFAIILVFCQVGDPINLWEKHRDSLAEDVKKQFEAEQVNIDLYLDIIYNQCLVLLEDIVISMSGKALLQF